MKRLNFWSLCLRVGCAARNAMSDPRNLNFEKQPKNYAQLKAELTSEASGTSGKTLYENIIAAAKQQVKELGCFVAGTLVHTREGLVPIEKIKVGDYVLSKLESGEGEQSYQRVTRTYEYEDREVYFAAWVVEDRVVPRAKPVDFSKLERGYVVVTGAHPFRVRQVETVSEEGRRIFQEVDDWMSIESMHQLDSDDRIKGGAGLTFHVELVDGRVACLRYPEALLQDNNHNIGIGFYSQAWDWGGTEVQFTENGPIATIGNTGIFYKERGLDIDIDEETLLDYQMEYDSTKPLNTQLMGRLLMRRKVYNIEVENTHTYFVGVMGAWVHNISGIVEKTLTHNPVKDVGVYMYEKGKAAFHKALRLQQNGNKGIAITPDIDALSSGGQSSRVRHAHTARNQWCARRTLP